MSIRRYIGNDQTRASARQAVEATGMRMPPPKRMHMGNFSQLRNEKSAYLQHMQGGYFNPNIQRARYTMPRMSNNIPNAAPLAGLTSSPARILDKRMKGLAPLQLIKRLK